MKKQRQQKVFSVFMIIMGALFAIRSIMLLTTSLVPINAIVMNSKKSCKDDDCKYKVEVAYLYEGKEYQAKLNDVRPKKGEDKLGEILPIYINKNNPEDAYASNEKIYALFVLLMGVSMIILFAKNYNNPVRKKSKGTINNQEEEKPVIKEPYKSDKVDDLIAKMNELSHDNYYKGTLMNMDEDDLFASKVGGFPYWTRGKEYPKDKNGNPAYLLVQVNFEREKFDSPLLPKKGILQLFEDLNHDHHVVYHENIDYGVTISDIVDQKIPTNEDLGEYELATNKRYAINFSEYKYNSKYTTSFDFFDAVVDKYKIPNATEDRFFANDDDLYYYSDQMEMPGQVQLLGYANFIFDNYGYNFRAEQKKEYNCLLFCLSGSAFEYGDALDQLIYINKDKLKELKFDDVFGDTSDMA